MKISALKKSFMTASILIAVGHVGIATAHTVGGVIDGGGANASATDLGAVNCFDDTGVGAAPPAYLFTQIQDQSGPVPGLLISVQTYKGHQMTNTTDPVSGDAGASPGAQLNGGAGVYYISASKTAAGARLFTVTYHCMTAGNIHTGTELTGLQIQ